MLILPLSVRQELESWAAAGYPNETCGLLIGRSIAGQVDVLHVASAQNLNRERARDRYELDPAGFLAADQTARERSLDIVGVWHSHPDHRAEPSETDRAGAHEGWSYLIAAVTRSGVIGWRAWRLERERFVEEPLHSHARTPR